MADTPQTKTSEGTLEAPEPAEPKQWTLKYGEEQITVDEAKLVQMAQLGFGGHRKMEEAATIRKQADEFRGQVTTLLNAVDQGDAQAYENLLKLSALSPAEQVARVQAFRDALVQTAEPETRGRKQEKQPMTLMDMPPELQQAAALGQVLQGYTPEQVRAVLDAARQNAVDQQRQQVYQEMDRDIDGDRFLGYHVRESGPRAELIREMARKELAGRIRNREEYGPGLRASVLKEVTKTLKGLGIGDSTSTSPPGLGPSPGLSWSEAQAHEPPEPVSATDIGYADNVAKRMAAFMAGVTKR